MMILNRDKAEYLIFSIISKAVILIGFKRVKYPAKALAFLFFNVIPIRKKVVIGNLRKAFPEKSDKEILSIAKKNYLSFAITFLEIMAMPGLTEKNVLDYAESDSLDVLKKAAGKGKGVFMLTAHFGNWEYAGTWIGVKLNRSILGLAKKQRNPYVNDWLTMMRGKFGNRELRPGAGLRALISAARKGEIIGTVGDQRGSKEGPRVKFFGHDTACYTGTAALSVKLGTPIVLSFYIRQADGTYYLTFEKFECKEDDEFFDNHEICLTQKYFKRLEEVIRKHPEQWLWMHNIWKY